ncbi:hypothetical protein L1987_08963 [Smallanthus sonchifolius]|uniref:Uncharacterized protein n=1 Tax=Smallanthus sonchifolius TaxID=185202 RepID=A0ACB9JNR9_9ASTR|nr:hypothetical protein L1987_08963 [Smallanthus sonchifolius]
MEYIIKVDEGEVEKCISGFTALDVAYEGRFEILSLSGSFMVSEVGGQCSRMGGLSVALLGPDEGKPIPTELRNEDAALRQEIDLEDERTADPTAEHLHTQRNSCGQLGATHSMYTPVMGIVSRGLTQTTPKNTFVPSQQGPIQAGSQLPMRQLLATQNISYLPYTP